MEEKQSFMQSAIYMNYALFRALKDLKVPEERAKEAATLAIGGEFREEQRALARDVANLEASLALFKETQDHMRRDQKEMKRDITVLKAGQEEMKRDITVLKVGQEEIKREMTRIRGDLWKAISVLVAVMIAVAAIVRFA